MAEHIKRDDLLQDISETVVFTVRKGTPLPNAEMRGANKVIDRIKSAPIADVVEVRHGEWKESDWVKYDGHGECVHYPKQALCCTECHHCFKKELLYVDNYCPNCGAKMDGKGDTE